MSILSDMGLVPKEKQRKIEYLDVDLLDENPDNFYDTSNVETLKAAIVTAGGVRQNLIVQPTSNGRYQIISGHRRCKAMKELIKEHVVGIENKVPCEIETDDMNAQLLLITTNSSTRKLNAWERVEQYRRLESLAKYYQKTGKLSGRRRDAIADMMNDNHTNVARYQAIANNLLPSLNEWLKDGRLGISAAYEVCKEPIEAQQQFEEEVTPTEAEKTGSISLTRISTFFALWHWNQAAKACASASGQPESPPLKEKPAEDKPAAVKSAELGQLIVEPAQAESVAVQHGGQIGKTPGPSLEDDIRRAIKRHCKHLSADDIENLIHMIIEKIDIWRDENEG